MDWKELLVKSIEELKFEENELAFLALQGKIELQLRDKIAWALYKKGYKNVKKEYAPKDIDAGRSKCDLAILDDNLNPQCLVEFKAHSSQNWENQYKKAFEKDMDKMRDFSKNKNVDLFYIYFQTYHVKSFNTPREKMLVVYSDIINRTVRKDIENIDLEIYRQWEKICEKEARPDLIKMHKIEAGEYLGDKPIIYAMIYGPLKN